MIAGSLLEDLRACGVTRFQVFEFAGHMTDDDGFHVIAPRDEIASSLGCLRRKLPAGVHIKPYAAMAWPERQAGSG